MSEPKAEPPPVAKGTSRKKLVWIAVCVLSIVAGVAAPIALGSHKLLGTKSAAPVTTERELTTVPFGDVAVNLSDGRMNRYLRIKIVILIDETDSKDFTKRLEKHKPVLKDWLISQMSGKTLKEVGGTVGVKRAQREIQEHFEEILYPNGDGKTFEVLFEDFIVQ